MGFADRFERVAGIGGIAFKARDLGGASRQAPQSDTRTTCGLWPIERLVLPLRRSTSARRQGLQRSVCRRSAARPVLTVSNTLQPLGRSCSAATTSPAGIKALLT
jgi:hypothetical protein